MTEDNGVNGGPPLRSVPVDWEALEDAFENNAPEVHSYLHLLTGEVFRTRWCGGGRAPPTPSPPPPTHPRYTLPAHRSGELARAVPLDGALHPDGRGCGSSREARRVDRRQGG